MFTIIVCSIIILYCIVKLIYLNEFVISINDTDPLPGIDAVMILITLMWFIVQLFLYSGPVVVVAGLSLVLIDISEHAEWSKKILCTRALLLIMIASNIIIGVNHLHFKFSMWKELYALIS